MWRDAMGTCHCVTINFEGWTCPASGSVSPSFTTFSAPGRTERPQQSGFSGRSPTPCLPPFWEPSRYRPRLSVLRDDHWDRRKGCRVADAVIEAEHRNRTTLIRYESHIQKFITTVVVILEKLEDQV